MTKYPALYAALEPDDVNGRRGSTVRCTATRRSIGFIWWEVTTGTTVVWHWRTGEHFGERTTERNAVLALRDISNLGAQSSLPLGDDEPAPVNFTSRPRAVVAAPVPQRIVWPDEQAPDVTKAMAAAFARQEKK